MILDIFAQHAQTKEGRLQIELAQLEYMMPRLRRMWTHLERQKGGIGLRGPGEKQLEVDRRRIGERIHKIKNDLKKVRRHRNELRRGRRRHGWTLFSMVGYTNAGKSTLLNSLAGSAIKAIDQLFATLDPTTRQIDLPDHQSALLTDTVGFIRKLPHHLVESFKATLEEVIEADVLLHVIDTSHPQVGQQIEAVMKVLGELGVADKPILSVFNKLDRSEAKDQYHFMTSNGERSVCISAHTGEGLSVLRAEIADFLKDQSRTVRLRIPLAKGNLIASLKGTAHIFEEKYDHENAQLEVRMPKKMMRAYGDYVC